MSYWQRFLYAIQAIDGAKVYIYALWSESDGYTLTSEQQRLLALRVKSHTY